MFLSWEATRRVSLGEDDIRLIPSAIGDDRDKAYDALNGKFGAATIQRGSNLRSELRVSKKDQAQMEQKQIYTFCKEHEIDLAPIILKQKTWTEPSENLVLYHGSKERIIGDIKTVTRSEYDFGKGFYMGTTTPQPLTLVYA